MSAKTNVYWKEKVGQLIWWKIMHSALHYFAYKCLKLASENGFPTFCKACPK